MSTSSKKVNPRKIPVNQADLKKAKKEAVKEAIRYHNVLTFTVLGDKFGFDHKKMHEFWGYINDLSDSLNEGYINFNDLRHVLEEEYQVRFV